MTKHLELKVMPLSRIITSAGLLLNHTNLMKSKLSCFLFNHNNRVFKIYRSRWNSSKDKQTKANKSKYFSRVFEWPIPSEVDRDAFILIWGSIISPVWQHTSFLCLFVEMQVYRGRTVVPRGLPSLFELEPRPLRRRFYLWWKWFCGKLVSYVRLWMSWCVHNTISCK